MTPAGARGWLAALPFAVLTAGCYVSSVVAEQDRAVAVDIQALDWQPATAADLQGLYESIAIEGDAAVSLRRIWYWFAADGRYAGAALTEGEGGIHFQTVNGTWQLLPAGLVLDDGAPARLAAAAGHLRIAADSGTLVLRRAELQ
jgi:hypothetical protein